MKVLLTYFKRSTGKCYTSGEYETQAVLMHVIHDEIRRLHDAGVYPGLTDGVRTEFITLIEVPEHKNNSPKLIIPKDEPDVES